MSAAISLGGFRNISVALLLLAASGHASASASSLTPFYTQNLSPFTALLGGPRWESLAGLESNWRVRVDTDVASHFSASRSGNERVLLDGETFRNTIVLRRKLGSAWMVGVDIPCVRLSGGAMDQFVDGWHDLFGLPDGGRDSRPRDLLEFEYRRDGLVVKQLTDSQAGLGDVSVTAGRVLGASGLEIHARLKLPTGDAEKLTGSGASDVSLMVTQQRSGPAASRWRGYYWGAGLVRLKQGDLVQPVVEDWLVVGLLGSAYSLTPRVDLKAQLEATSAPYESQVEELGDPSLQVSFGASIQVARNVVLDIALSEDLITNTAPDVAFHLGLVWDW